MKITRANEIKIICLAAMAILTLVSLVSFDRGDITFLTSNPNIAKHNIAGSVGAYLGWFLLFLVGYGAYVIPFFLVMWGITYFLEEKPRKFYLRIFGITFSILAVSSIFSLVGLGDTVHRFGRGGIVGLAFSNFLMKYLGAAGTLIVIATLFLLSFTITTDFLIFPLLGWLPKVFKALMRAAKRIPSGFMSLLPPRKPRVPAGKERLASPGRIDAKREAKEERTIKERIEAFRNAKKPSLTKEPIQPEGIQTKSSGVTASPVPVVPYVLPPLDLLGDPPPIAEREVLKEDLEGNSKILEETLGDFDIKAKVVGVSKGPVITRYELLPERGVTISRITALSDNIALAMKSVSIRVVAPIPGKGTIGVEVPNAESALVYLKEILAAKEYTDVDSKLKLALGKDISGAPIVTDLDDMPHLLIAGATGSGKTVCVNSIIISLLFNASPEEVRFLMVDPKRVELAAFNDLPHLLAPVVTDPKKVSHALNWAVKEMEGRYTLFAKIGVRNIAGYNKRAKIEKITPIPYIVVIIDELADLMLVAQQEIETTVARLAQLSRAVGIHMIIATQRPSVDVITGVIKANFPARISFKVASKVDSRTVIDMNGAEKLLGRGDMLFVEPGSPKPVRAQGCLVSDETINKVTTYIKSQRPANFVEDILKAEDVPKHNRKFDKDEVYDEAVSLVLQSRQASVSMLQRRLGVGYTRAARLIDMMEDSSIVGPYQGSKPREILVEDLPKEN
ncbi:MAG: DNA translocase FtsK [Omnitrophica bacterium]|nr:DNA translocase FtsK [Candidatus Omnitrophota bacterium]